MRTLRGIFAKHQTKRIHNLTKHYEDGEITPSEDKPIDKERVGDVQMYKISFSKHGDYYDVYNSD